MEFLSAVDRNEPLLRDLQPDLPSSTWKVFRYPYLHESEDLAVRDDVRRALLSRNYRIAQVTVDPYDWAYEETYVRCFTKGAPEAMKALRDTFLSEARAKLRWAEAQARLVEGRPIRHILLLHLGALDADAIDSLLADYEKMGVRWITFDEAVSDAVYQKDPHVPGGENYVFQLLRARGMPLTPQPQPPFKLFDSVCP